MPCAGGTWTGTLDPPKTKNIKKWITRNSLARRRRLHLMVVVVMVVIRSMDRPSFYGGKKQDEAQEEN
ncbi:hypothetical protein L1049_002151 [Liquidambar formosana]|uniref:Uncharacterized protein n=1 Tax=Liquidambar formosana TaxID=63359 RepID=A0AAP0NED6_LIQFO